MAKIDQLSDQMRVIHNWVRTQNSWFTARDRDKRFKLALEFDGADLLIYPVANAPFFNIDQLATLVKAMNLSSYAQVQPFDKHYKVTFRIYD